MTTHHDHAEDLALTEARELLRRLAGSNARDRVAFTLGYILAFDDMAPHLPSGDIATHLLRAQALHAICDKDLQ